VTEFEEDFASMFEASHEAKRVDKGQTVDGVIVGIGHGVAFVNVGGKGEALIELAELKNDAGELEVAVGDRIQAMVVSTEGGLTLSRRLARGSATDRQLEDAYRAGLPVEGKVERDVKGGYEVRVGKSRAFCPASQIDTVRNTDPAQHIGRNYAFRIIEYKEGGRNLIVSRRALLEDAQQAEAVELRRSMVPGAVVTGRVVSVRDFGAFVDLGAGIQGLLHVSEMGWSRVADTAQFLAAGDTVTVKVLRVDESTQKIALSMKQLVDDPWATVQERFEVGQTHTGRVTRVADFGAFVELEPGIEGLAHVSTFAPTGHSKGWARLVPTGATASFEILTIDLEKKRIGVALAQDGSATPAAAGAAATPRAEMAPGTIVTGRVERHESFGVFVSLAPGRTGLMPLSETGVPREGDVGKAFPVGSEIEVVILDVDQSGRRIRISRKAVIDAREAEVVREYAERADAVPSEAFGSLADKLRGAFKPALK
jgi:small subunit ribosomal protein S1